MTDQQSTPKPPDFHDLQWDNEHLGESIDKLYTMTIHRANGAISWYRRNTPKVKRAARWARTLAILFAALGGIIPTLSQLTPAIGFELNPLWSTVAIALAGGALAFDRFFGNSSAWIRYITAEMRLSEMLQNFQFQWESERLAWQGKAPNFDQAQLLVAQSSSFLKEISKVVQDETQMWVLEFQSTLKALDDNLKASAEQNRKGAINVTVENGASFEKGWKLFLEDKSLGTYSGTTGAINNLLPGFYTIKVEARAGDRTVQAVSVASVVAGQISTLSLTIPTA